MTRVHIIATGKNPTPQAMIPYVAVIPVNLCHGDWSWNGCIYLHPELSQYNYELLVLYVGVL